MVSDKGAVAGERVHILTCADAAEFLAYAGPALRADEVRYGILYSHAFRCSEPSLCGSAWYAVVFEEGLPLAAALLNVAGVLHLAKFSDLPDVCAGLIGATLLSESRRVSSLVGDPVLCGRIFDFLRQQDKCGSPVVKEYRLYKLETLSSADPPEGNFRRAGIADKPLIAQWGTAFHYEVTGGANAPPPEPFENRVDTGAVFVWETAAPVCMAGITRPLDHSVGIGPVYTPPEFRSRGYARACVAALCRMQLDSGYGCCTLFTDKSNPASAALYEQIGFEAVGDFVEMVFPR